VTLNALTVENKGIMRETAIRKSRIKALRQKMNPQSKKKSLSRRNIPEGNKIKPEKSPKIKLFLL
jgi:hypothetical protein